MEFKERVKVISLSTPERDKLCEIFKVHRTVICQSLTFLRNGEIHQRIRMAAMRNGGKMLVECVDWDAEMIKNK